MRKRLLEVRQWFQPECTDTGILLGAFSQPFPNLVSANFAYRYDEKLMMTVGGGTFLIGNTFGAGVQYLPMGHQALTPMLGLNLAVTATSDSWTDIGIFKSTKIGFVSSTANVGLGWQLESGFHVDAGLNWLWLTFSRVNVGTRVFPYLNIGWFF